MGNVNQNTPYGSISYTDSSGGVYDPNKAPTFTSTINLTPESQAILDSQMRSEKQLANLGEQQLGRINESAATPFSYAGLPAVFGEGDTLAAQQKAEDAIYSRLDPQFARDEEALRSRLINQGIGQGSQAYNTEFDRFNQAKNDARQQAVLGGQQYASALLGDSLTRRNQGIQEYTTERNAPLNEYNAFTSGTQIQNPTFQSSGYGGAQSGDLQGAAKTAYDQQMQQYNSKVAQNNATTSAAGSFLGTAASAAIPFLFSDERLKENIKLVGKTFGGHNVYTYNYKGDDKTQMGVIAQEVIETQPEAVAQHESGFLMVNYGALQ